MSIKVMTYVWEHSRQKASALLMLLAIADHAHDDGAGAWPSIKTLASKTRMTERNAQYLIDKLIDAGELIRNIAAGPKGVNTYAIPLNRDRVKPVSPLPAYGVNQASSGGENQRKKGVKAIAPKSSLEPSMEPSDIISVDTPINTSPESIKEKTLTAQQQMIHDLAQVMGIDDKLNGARLARFASELLKQKYEPCQIINLYGAGGTYWSQDWRGKQGQVPNETAIRQTIASFNGRNGSQPTQPRGMSGALAIRADRERNAKANAV